MLVLKNIFLNLWVMTRPHIDMTIPSPVAEAPGIAVAFSGGADSLALLTLLRAMLSGGQASTPRLMALHCNFHLRGEESDADTKFCIDKAAELDIPIAVKHFKGIKDVMASTGESLEMCCRRLRYEWFGEFTSKGWYIALGHHRDDNIETVFLNMLRITGLKGMAGMKTLDKERKLWRPLLCVKRKEIENYLAFNNLRWRTDSSNLVDDVQRNKLRLRVLPEMESCFPDAGNALSRTIGNLNADLLLFNERIRELKARVYDEEDGKIDLGLLRSLTEAPARVLMEILSPMGFNASVCETLANIEEGKGYREFLSPSHRLYSDAHVAGVFSQVQWEKLGGEPVHAASLQELARRSKAFKIGKVGSEEAAQLIEAAKAEGCGGEMMLLDAEALESAESGMYTWRPICEGDRITPFGMKGRGKLVSDILTDLHADPVFKRKVRVLVSPSGKILWLAPVRVSAHYTVDSRSETIYLVTLTKPKHKPHSL